MAMDKSISVSTDKTILEIRNGGVVYWINQDLTGRYYLFNYERTEIYYSELGGLIEYITNADDVKVSMEDLKDSINLVFEKGTLRLIFFGYGEDKQKSVDEITKFIASMIKIHKNKKCKHSKHRAKGRLCKNCAYFRKNSCGVSDYPLCDLDSLSIMEVHPWQSCENHIPDNSWTLPSKWITDENENRGN